MQAEKEAKEALFNEKESLTQEVTRLTEGKERQEIIIQELEGLCMRLQEALDAKSNNSAINSARKSQVLMQVNRGFPSRILTFVDKRTRRGDGRAKG